MLLELAQELLVEILEYLKPSDIILSSRLVCQRLYKISQDRSVWLNILARCDYVLPRVNVSCTSTYDLERLLLRAEKVKDVWTGKRPPLRDGLEISIDLEAGHGYVGLMGNYVVLQQTPSKKWSWYTMDSLQAPEGQAPAFSLMPEVDPTFQRLLTCTFVIAKDSGIFYAAYTMKELLPEGEICYLKVVSVNVLYQDQFESKLELSHRFESQNFFKAISTPLGPRHCPLELYAGYGYLTVHSSLVAPSEPIHIFDLRTGKLILCPWWYDKDIDEDEINYLLTDLEFTPWHQLIQIRPDDVLEFYQLPDPTELLQAKDKAHARAYKTNTFRLLDGERRLSVIPRSPTSCQVLSCGGQPGPILLRLVDLDLLSSTTSFKCTYPLGLRPDSKFWLSQALFTNPPNVQSALAIGIDQQIFGNALIGIWINLNIPALQAMPIAIVEQDTPHDPRAQEKYLRVELDPLSGRIIRYSVGFDGGVRRFLARDYVVSTSCDSHRI